ncbi:TetR/AcrR family transcriptional regulator [Streptomyces sp. NPDC060194]|uniref:TetR/AcrR family transcriptional regulator n=1 Tax=Streptomyces sp. NPDC060194 TaxID=3347069 RepID=UPI0036479F7D
MRQDGVRARQREQTRADLLREGRRLFTAHGYAGVSLAEVVGAAGVTKGALYHHFPGKTELFRAVLADVQQEVGARVAAEASTRDDLWEQLLAGCAEFLAAALDPDVQRVLLVDGPAVLGWAEWRAMDAEASGRHLSDALHALLAAGVLAPQPVPPLVHLLSGAMNEAALWLAASPRPTDDLAVVRAALERMLGALRAA